MRVEVADAFPEADVLAIPVGPNGIPAGGDIAGAARIAEEEDVGAKAGRTAVLYAEEPSKRFVLVGLGPADELDADTVRTAAAAVAGATERIGGTIAWLLDGSLPKDEQARAVVDGLILGTYDPGRWKSSSNADHPFERLVLVGADQSIAESAERAARIADGANRARDLANTGANELTPKKLAKRAAEIADEHEHLTVEALGPDEFTKLGMGAFAGVAQGSHNPARMIVIRYEPPSPKGDVVLGLVGKAITFDTGGISIKPALYMEDMKGDMAGGAAVIEGTGAIAELGLPVRVLAVVAATENMPGGGAYRPGDILTAMNGKTIEVINTDAEGRLVLADALAYLAEKKQRVIIDTATLTGACMVALGDQITGAMGNDDALFRDIAAAGDAVGEKMWPLPMYADYRRLIDSTVADVKNIGERWGGAISAAWFLAEFVGDTPWMHLDIAGPAWAEKVNDLGPKGGTGVPVRTLVRYVLDQSS
jgi:leucyl aminopeptidase